MPQDDHIILHMLSLGSDPGHTSVNACIHPFYTVASLVYFPAFCYSPGVGDSLREL